MSNENKVAPITGVQAQQKYLVSEVQETMKSVGCEITPYGTKCAMNAVAGIVSFLATKNKTLKEVNSTMLKLSIQNVAVLELNYASVPSEIYFDLRGDILTIKTQGAGNEKLVRKYGVGIVKDTGLHRPWLIREGDEFTYPSFNGLEITPPTWKPKFDSTKKVIAVLYIVEKTNGEIEYLIADRESIKSSVVAQIRQNALYGFKNAQGYNDTKKRDEFYEQLNKDAENMLVDELIECPKYQAFINPTYTSVSSKEAMIVRKMMNKALRTYPKEFDDPHMREAIDGINEDFDETLTKKKYVGEVDATEVANQAVEKEPDNDNAVKDIQFNDQGEIIEAEVKHAEPKETEPQNDTQEAETQEVEQDNEYPF